MKAKPIIWFVKRAILIDKLPNQFCLSYLDGGVSSVGHNNIILKRDQGGQLSGRSSTRNTWKGSNNC